MTSLIVAVASGLAGGWIALRFKLKEISATHKLDTLVREREAKAKVKLYHLDPLRIAAEDLCERLKDIRSRIETGDTLLHDTICQFEMNRFPSARPDGREERLVYPLWKTKEEYCFWANDWGHFALSTLHMTAVYFAYASRLRFYLPQVELSYSDDATLLFHLNQVRRTMGGPYGIWEDLQDSLGSYIRRVDGSLMSYREFCEEVFDENQYMWYVKLFNFYKDIKLKQESEIEEMISSLEALRRFLGNESQ